MSQVVVKCELVGFSETLPKLKTAGFIHDMSADLKFTNHVYVYGVCRKGVSPGMFLWIPGVLGASYKGGAELAVR